ncbi:MAG: hypothetical protein MR868_14790 [Lachnospiraceae bacterium]|nr:hypothetical protein [Lachnospiraceae bacterium]
MEINMIVKNILTGNVLTEKELKMNWEMDVTYERLNEREDMRDHSIDTFTGWFKQRLETGDYEIIKK